MRTNYEDSLKTVVSQSVPAIGYSDVLGNQSAYQLVSVDQQALDVHYPVFLDLAVVVSTYAIALTLDLPRMRTRSCSLSSRSMRRVLTLTKLRCLDWRLN